MKVSVIIPHYQTWVWTAVCVHAFRKFPVSVEQEIIVVNNSPEHPSIKVLTETELGKGARILCGYPDFYSHGMGYDVGAASAESDWLFTSETDSFPTRKGWFEPYKDQAMTHDANLIGPEIPQGAGRYIHPAGALISRKILNAAGQWREQHKEWMFAPGAAIEAGLSDKAYHVVAKESWLADKPLSAAVRQQIELWKAAKAWQEMRAFEDDDFATYMHRTMVHNFTPQPGRDAYHKIGYEAGQWLAYFAEAKGWKVVRAPVKLEWMNGFEGQQAARSVVFDGFMHVWCGTVSSLDNNINPYVRAYKLEQADEHFNSLPKQLREKIDVLRKHHPD